jgi:phospholipid/cholesterol/gamma-HCH transport system substrate-binding protein
MRRSNEVLVGLFVTVALIILVGGTVWLTRGGFRRGYPLYAKFSWGQNLKNGHPVLLAGQNVGYVSDVTLKPGYLDVELRITETDQGIPKGSTASVIPVGIFGDVAISFKPPLPLPATNYNPGDTVPTGDSPPDMGAILARVDTIGTSVSRLTSALEKEFVSGGGLRDLHRLTASMATTSEQLSRVIANQDRNLSVVLDDFRRTMNKFSTVLDSASMDSTVRNIKTMSANMNRLIAQVDSTNAQAQALLVKANSGNGTVGKLLTDSLLYTNIKNLTARTDSLLNDFMANPKKYIDVTVCVIRKC